MLTYSAPPDHITSIWMSESRKLPFFYGMRNAFTPPPSLSRAVLSQEKRNGGQVMHLNAWLFCFSSHREMLFKKPAKLCIPGLPEWIVPLLFCKERISIQHFFFFLLICKQKWMNVLKCSAWINYNKMFRPFPENSACVKGLHI